MSQSLWKPESDVVSKSRLTEFTHYIEKTYNVSFSSYADLHKWSVDNVAEFWGEIFTRSDLVYSVPFEQVLSAEIMPGAKWFNGAKLNFAENLLRYRDDRTAILHWRENCRPEYMSYSALYLHVAKLASKLRELGVAPGDRVVGYMPNIPETVIAMLAATSLGALWSSCSPDFGLQGALDRFGQIEPKVLFSVSSYSYQGKIYDIADQVTKLNEATNSIENVITIGASNESNHSRNSLSWASALDNDVTEIEFFQASFDHPVYVLYSSGTTGKPKCIVHGAGGTLLQHWKEHALHTNLSREDTLFYFTTCGWMMWNWLVSGLQIGCTICLYDGSPSYPSLESLWNAVEKENITVFGTSPKFLSVCQKKGVRPAQLFDLSSLKAVLSTGSPLSEENFRWVYDEVKSDVQLSSISGGTDIVSCFMLGNPNLPVFSSEIQSLGLGMKIETYSDAGINIDGEVGELVCTKLFPSMPVKFWDDEDGTKYESAYFDHFPGVWRHGDFIRITENGGVIIYGRSDATLNPGGVRIGTAEIYNPLEALDEITDSVVIGQQWKDDLRIVLFVVLQDGLKLSDELKNCIKIAIRKSATPRHVPALICQVKSIPYTISGKKVEITVTRIIHGQEISNREALANPQSLDEFYNIPELTD